MNGVKIALVCLLVAGFMFPQASRSEEPIPEGAPGNYVISIEFPKSVVGPDDPIYTTLMMENRGDDAVGTQADSRNGRTNSVYHLSLTRMADYYEFPNPHYDFIWYKDFPFFEEIADRSRTAFPPHSKGGIAAFDLRDALELRETLEPGLYKVHVWFDWEHASWERLMSDGFFIVKEDQTLQAISDVNSNIAYTQQKVVENTRGLKRIWKYISRLYYRIVYSSYRKRF